VAGSAAMKAALYLETSVVSYLTARSSRNVIVAAHQQITQDWWRRRRKDFDVCVSQFVLDEVAQGDAVLARQRVALVKPFRLLDATDDALRLAKALVATGVVPRKAAADAAHIAVAATHGVHFLMTWNCKHIANAEIVDRIGKVCRSQGFNCPVICTPEELIGE
jgi:hypothetical protein